MSWTPSKEFLEAVERVSTQVIIVPTILLIFVGLLISFKTRFVQIRAIPQMCRFFWGNLRSGNGAPNKRQVVSPNKALFTAMSTSLGLASMISPMIAIRLGGPGALLGYILATILGGAISFTEVSFAVAHRRTLPDGTVMGGPMQYLRDLISPGIAKLYSVGTVILMLIWSSTQANTVADLMDDYAIPDYVTGAVLAILVYIALIGGIKRIANISAKLVPIMFLVYLSAASWILLTNLERIPEVIRLVWNTAFHKQALIGGVVGGGMVQALRWGLLKGIHSNEAGVGTATIPHSMSATNNPVQQGMLSLVSIYTQGLLSLITGFVTIVAGTWNDPTIPVGVHITLSTFEMFFSTGGTVIVTLCVLLFGYGTILGNNYNGSQCFGFLTQNRYVRRYYVFVCITVFLGAIGNVELIWIMGDIFLIPILLINVLSLAWIIFKEPQLLQLRKV